MVPPVYPPQALRARIRGLVVLRVLVSETGTPLRIQVVESAPAGLTEAAVDAVRRWKFEPARRRGAPVEEWTTVRIPFEAIPFLRATETPGPAQTPAPAPVPASRPSPAVWPEPPEPPSAGSARPTAVFRTRGGLRFSVMPAQARITIDGRYVGISEDWDARAGGGLFELPERGPHRLHLELPGYRSLDAEIDVSPGAEEAAANLRIGLEEEERLPYARLPRPSAATTGALEIVADPADAEVTIDGRSAGRASSIAAEGPFWLPGPAVHEVTVSAPGRVPRSLRILAAPNAPSSKAVVHVRLVARP